MAPPAPPPRATPSRPLLAGLAVLLLAGLGLGTYLAQPAATPDRPAPPLPVPSVAAAPPQPAQAAATPPPSFDVVRVSPQGTAVIAGRAQPGAEIVLRDNGAELGRATADRRGEFVITPATPLAPGGRELTLAARESSAAPEVKGTGSVLLAIPQPSAGPTTLQALLVPNTGAPRVLQGPAPAKDAAQPISGTPHVSLDSVDYDDQGEIRFTGSAAPAAPLRVYVDNQAAGDTTANAQGHWTMTPPARVTPGVHQLRVDHLNAAGRVLARVELPFQRTALPAAEVAAGKVVVQPGQNLWRLARSAYGSGVRYTVIYLANRDQIRDPRLIYPGQAFAVPGPAP